MMQFFLYSISLILGFIFSQMIHPLAMGFMLLIQTLMICLISGLLSKSFWFSYILFLIFLGGMLVLFIYVTSLASNEMFSFSSKIFILSMFLIINFMIIILFILDKTFLIHFSKNNEMILFNSMNDLLNENSLNLNKLYNYPTNFVNILLMIYLLITLIAIVKITKLFFGPLRMMN
uniref:NADH-ubiquinone oxidoreductase chain 6 n=1 Tax=Pseudogriphoneura sp. ACMJ-2016 TaxID=1783256 RepID=A0A140CPA3_9MUSC|nr:NADH dehydrogenase subunit 6 [Pseudogriphoneura sp. ACMJ-2016]